MPKTDSLLSSLAKKVWQPNRFLGLSYCKSAYSCYTLGIQKLLDCLKYFFQFILGGTDYEKGYEMGHESFAQIR